MSKQQRKVFGYLDSVSENYITGWVFDAAEPNLSVEIELFVGNRYLGQWFSGYYREDLYLAGFGNGCHGFKIFLAEPISPTHVHDSIEIFVLGSKPIWLRALDGKLHPHPAIYTKKRAEFFRFYSKILSSIDGSEREKEESRDNGSIASYTPSRCLENIRIANREGISDDFDFLQFIQKKLKKFENTHKFYEWFVYEYLSYYPRDIEIPLAERDVQGILNAIYATRQPAPVKFERGISRLKRLAASSRSIPFEKTMQAYWWIVEGGRGLRLSEICVKSQALALLTRPIRFLGTSIPVNRFMIIFSIKRLGRSPLRLLFYSGRAEVYIWIFLLSQQNPFLLRCLPEGGLRQLICKFRENSSDMAYALKRVQSWGKPIRNTTDLALPKVILQQLNSYILDGKQGGCEIDFDVNLQIIGPFSKVLGLSESCRRLGSLIRENVDPSCCLTDYQIGNLSPLIENKYNKEIKKAKINIIHLNSEEIPEFYIRNRRIIESSYNILYPYWELDTLSSVHFPGVKLVDEIWTASDFIARAFKGAKENVFRIGLPPASFEYNRSFRNKTGEFVFLSTFDALSWPQRKNVAAVIEAFMLAFEIEVQVKLIVKCHNADKINEAEQKAEWRQIVSRCQSDNRICLLNETLDRSQQEYLLSSSDCLVSLHRAEGLGIDILDCLANGIPVIATAYSGNMDICSHSNCWLVDYSLIAINESSYAYVEEGHMWAEINLDSAVKAFRSVFFEPTERERKSARAVRDVAAIASADVIASKILERLTYFDRASEKFSFRRSKCVVPE